MWQEILFDKMFGFDQKFNSVRNLMRQEILFGMSFKSARNFIWWETLFDKNFYSIRNYSTRTFIQ